MPTGSALSTIGIGGSMSTSSPKVLTGWHVLKVEAYSWAKSLPGGTRIKSSTFTVGGHNWWIGYFPSGCWAPHHPANPCNDWVSVNLNLEDAAACGEVFTQFKFSVLDHAGETVSSQFQEISDKYTFSSKSASHSISFFVKKRVLESLYVKDDSLRIKCDITVIKDIDAEDTTVEPVAVPPPDLHSHLGNLLESQVGGDVTFNVGGKHFTAHRYVLAARSSVFMAQLFGPMRERTSSHVRIDDMDARVFEVMLRFIYTDMLPDFMEGKTVMAQHLLVAADRYNMDRLKLICENILCKGINTAVVATTLVLAEQHGCRELKDACFKFLMSPGNLKTVMASDGFQHLKKCCPSLLDELVAKFAP